MPDVKDQQPQHSRLDRFINHPSTQALIGLIVIITFMFIAYRSGEHEARVECGIELNEIDQLRKDAKDALDLRRGPGAAPDPELPRRTGVNR